MSIMTDVVDSATRSRMMAGIRSKDTKPEMFLRRTLHALGFRYRLNGCGLPGKPDLVFPSRKIVIFVHGCFWHKHECKLFKWPSSNTEFWKVKIEKNAERDAKIQIKLEEMGWKVLNVWECELKNSSYKLPNFRVDAVIDELKSISK